MSLIITNPDVLLECAYDIVNIGTHQDNPKLFQAVGINSKSSNISYCKLKDGEYIFCLTSLFRRAFPLLHIKNNNTYISTGDAKMSLKIPCDTELGKSVYTNMEILQIKDKLNKSFDFIKGDDRNKYCVCFLDKVMATTDTFLKAKHIADTEFQYLATTIYLPENLLN